MHIPLQNMPLSRREVLSSEQADVKYSSAKDVLEKLNGIFNTSLVVDNAPLRSLFESYISKGLDLGAIYARLRTNWPSATLPQDKSHERPLISRAEREQFSVDVRRAVSELAVNESSEHLEDDVVHGVAYVDELGVSEANNRQGSVSRMDEIITRDAITNPSNIRPRRLWDLFANRVIPYHYHYSSHRRDASNNPIRYPFCAISHSWTDDMVGTDTPINGNEWPVPVPAGVSLDAVRNEMLNMGEEYVWLDALCLRQVSKDPASEELRKEEWVVDLPTIGILYDHYAGQVVWYMNGLGRAFEGKGWDDGRHWLNRAWTLQEAKAGSIFGGIPEGILDPRKVKSTDTNELFEHRLAAVDLCRKERTRDIGDLFTSFVTAMKRRSSTNPIDKVFGIAMMFCEDTLPLYDGAMNSEDAWAKCVEHFSNYLLWTLLFDFHLPGEKGVSWRPSWHQLSNIDDAFDLSAYSSFRAFRGSLSVCPDGMVTYKGPAMEAHITPLERHKNPKYWVYKLTFQYRSKRESINIPLDSKHKLQGGDYVLVGNGSGSKWMVCTRNKHTDKHTLQKLAVVKSLANINLHLPELTLISKD